MKDKPENKEFKDLKELKLESEKFDKKFKTGRLNFNSPLNIFLRDYAKATLDDLLYHKDIQITEFKSECSAFIMKDSLIISNVINAETFKSEKDPILCKIDYKKIYYLEINKNENNTFTLVISLINDASLESFLKLNLIFTEENHAIIFRYFLDKQKTMYFHKYFEENVPIEEPHYYQNHFFLKKINSHGEKETRVMVVTNQFILNVDYSISFVKHPNVYENEMIFKVHKPKWAISIQAFEGLSTVEKEKQKGNLVVKIRINKDENKKNVTSKKLPYKNKTATEFMFYDEKSFHLFIFLIKKLSCVLKGKPVPVTNK